MSIDIFFIIAYFIFCLKASPKAILLSIFLLLPFHGFIKFALFKDTNTVFTIWKEIGIVFAYIKTMHRKNMGSGKLNCSVSFFLILLIVFLIIGDINHFYFLEDIRRFLFPILIIYPVSKIAYTESSIKKLIIYILIGSAIIDFTGVVDFLSPNTRLIMRTIMGTEFQIATDGTIYYNISSFKIMGLDRVCGLMGGGPNMMGMFNSVIFIIIVYAYVKKLFVTKVEKTFFYIASLLCLFCLITSFSRTGWALIAITFFYISVTNKRFRKISLYTILTIFVFGIIAYFSNDIVKTVINGTFSGNEASAAERSNMTHSALQFLISHPLGYGLGAANNNTNHVYFAESTIINLGISTGILGMLLYSNLLYVIFRIVKHNKTNPFIMITPGFIVAYYISSWVSINTTENPFVYYAWLIMGLGMNRYITNQKVH